MNDSYGKGLLNGFLAFTLWGFLPLYWKLLKAIPAVQIFSHRILWSFVLLVVLVTIKHRFEDLKVILKDRKTMVYVSLCAFFISCNWYLYIWAVNAGYVIEASLGYYMNPLAIVLLGTLVLKEELSLAQKIAFGFAAVGVFNLTFNYGRFPWVAVILALTFAFYGLFKKLAKVDAVLGLTLETSLLAPFALIFILFNEVNGIGVIGNVPGKTLILLVGVGAATATPLFWYSKAANTIPLSVIGFLQYIAPTINLILGVYVFKETFSLTHLVSFSFIWAGLALYSYTQLKYLKAQKKAS